MIIAGGKQFFKTKITLLKTETVLRKTSPKILRGFIFAYRKIRKILQAQIFVDLPKKNPAKINQRANYSRENLSP